MFAGKANGYILLRLQFGYRQGNPCLFRDCNSTEITVLRGCGVVIRCCSSGVERVLGKDEVVGSNPTSSPVNLEIVAKVT